MVLCISRGTQFVVKDLMTLSLNVNDKRAVSISGWSEKNKIGAERAVKVDISGKKMKWPDTLKM